MFRLLQSLIGSQGGRVPLASRGQRPRRRQAKPPHEVRILRAEHGYSARRRAVKTFKSAKGVWVGETNEVCLRNVRVFPHKQHIKSNCTYPPKQSGGLFRKHTTPLNYSFLSQAAFRLQTPIYITIYRPNFYSLELLKNSQHHRINPKARCKLPMKRSDHHADQN